MQTREIYKLHCRLARCEGAINLIAKRLAEIVDRGECGPEIVIKNLEVILYHIRAYRSAKRVLRANEVLRHPDWRLAGWLALAQRGMSDDSLMRRALRSSVIADAGNLLKYQPALYQSFKDRYRAALLDLRKLNRLNPTVFSIKYIWMDRRPDASLSDR